ncbi:methylated-DNA--[protein]-cysteine S-methyltransferase [Solimonas soli]|uniref:methylated-DNA--[protein]-cysteine S-methyltransferase n=1 Tax=Solimonas soli TaxID=413479 RepID=UPI000485568C|nr:methylated-DNA--[protein]-cysteine S-methyltransferase [Solimonas soli]
MNRKSPHTEALAYRWLDSPVGRLRLVAGARGLVAVLWEQDGPHRVPLTLGDECTEEPLLRDADTQLREYFAGVRKTFALPLDFRGTAFQQRVWQALLRIPFGETRSYAQVAAMLGAPNAARAVGAANGRNPLSIIAPCHRVVGSDGTLTGFAGGLAAKARLLHFERARTPHESTANLRG